MEAAIHNIQNATKSGDGPANDWVLASSGMPHLSLVWTVELTYLELDKLLRFISRHQTSMISSPIPPSGHIPPAFLQTLVQLESGVSKTITSEKAAAKKMAPVKAKAVTGMRQTLKKKMKEFEAVLLTYNEVYSLYRLPSSSPDASRILQAMLQCTNPPMPFPL